MAMNDNLANPAPLGLMGFGMTTVLLNMHNAGFYPLDSMIVAMGIFYGGVAQVVAGIMEWRKNNTFGTTAFTSYGLFWLSFGGLILLQKGGWCEGPTCMALATYLFMWGLFTFFMWIATWKLHRGLQVVFCTLTILFWMLALRDAFGWSGAWAKLTGIEGIFCGFSAIYVAMAQILSDAYGKTILPLGEKSAA
jgi:succinate-acetate transporter protein